MIQTIIGTIVGSTIGAFLGNMIYYIKKTEIEKRTKGNENE